MDITRRCFLAGAGTLAAGGVSPSIARAADLPIGQSRLGLDTVRDGLIYVPKSHVAGVPMPLVVVFHGAGGTGLSTAYVFPMADEFGFIVLAPDSRDERTWDLILGSYGPDADFLSAALRQTFARVAVDRQRLSVAGHSDGASYALSFGLGAGDVFGHILAFSPGVMTPVAATGKPRVFISHGIRDPVMPIDDTSRKFVPRLTRLGYDVTYREYEGQHGVPVSIVHEGFAWLGP